MESLWPHFAVPGGGFVALALALGAGAMVWLELRRRGPRALAALRILTALAIVLVAAQPRWTLERSERSEGRLAVLYDGSRSMRIQDRTDELTRLLDGWRAESEGVALYRFGARTSSARWGDSVPAPSDDESRLFEALESAAREDRAGEIGAFVLVSDGATREPEATPDVDGRKVHVVALGTAEIRDDAVAELEADPVAFLRTPAEVRVVVRRLGASGAVPVTLRAGDEVVAEELVDVPDGETREVTLSFTPRRLGRAIYTVSIPSASGDEVPENDERSFLVRVERARLRVLLVAGEPTWDVRFLRGFLKRDPSIDLISFFILRTTADLTMAAPEELALIPFPTDELFREHLGSFDVLVFQSFDYGPYQMASYLPRIRDYVRRGGSFAMVGGERSFGSGGYAGTPIAEILPVILPPASTPPARLVTPGRFSPRVEPELARHPLVALSPDPAANVEAWSRLAPLEGVNVVQGAREETAVLLSHPSARGPQGPLPVLVVGDAGEGRVLALTSDTSWRWGITTGGLTGDASTFERFWDRTLRWLARDPTLEPATLTTDRERYGPSARVRITARLRDARYQPIASRRVRAQIVPGVEGAALAVHEAEVTTDVEGQLSVTLQGPDAPGPYRAQVIVAGDDAPLATELFVVEAGGDELADPRPNHTLLARLAETTGGASYDGASAAPRLAAFDTTRVRHLGIREVAPFATGWAFALLVALLGAEWWVRRRAGAR